MSRKRPGVNDETPLDPSASARAPSGDLLLVTGEGRLSSHPLRGEVVIGRDPGCDVVVSHTALSRRHAIVRAGPPMTVQDLGSTNGTRIGTASVRGGGPVAIAVGDSFHIGPFSFMAVASHRGDERSASGRDLLRVADPTPEGVPGLVRELAASDVNVLLLGETGVGKEVLAQTLHTLSRRAGELVRINCAALAEPLLESELFGHEKGAFTGAVAARPGLLEAARGGTVFLDEIGEMPLGLQAKMLRAVEQREIVRLGSTRPIPIDVRFVAATNRDLPAEVTAGRFRRDLYFRLDGVTLAIPPLRERKDQIGTLALAFLAAVAVRSGKPAVKLGADVLAALERHGWPGNVRELKAVLERAVLLARGADPQVRHLAFGGQAEAPAAAPAPRALATAPGDEPDHLTGAEREDRARVVRALDDCAGNQTRAAKQLGIARTTLVNKVRLYRIPRPRS